MNANDVKAILDQSRNGANEFYRHPLFNRFIYSDGVKDLADLGCYWVLDLIAPMKVPYGALGVVKLSVPPLGVAKLTIETSDEGPPSWSHNLDWTTFPPGDWTLFFVQDYGDNVTCILPSEY